MHVRCRRVDPAVELELELLCEVPITFDEVIGVTPLAREAYRILLAGA
jgi:hypothetical protein